MVINLQTAEDYVLNLKGNLVIKEVYNGINFLDKRMNDIFWYRNGYVSSFLDEMFYLNRVKYFDANDYILINIFPLYYPDKVISLWNFVKA